MPRATCLRCRGLRRQNWLSALSSTLMHPPGVWPFGLEFVTDVILTRWLPGRSFRSWGGSLIEGKATNRDWRLLYLSTLKCNFWPLLPPRLQPSIAPSNHLGRVLRLAQRIARLHPTTGRNERASEGALDEANGCCPGTCCPRTSLDSAAENRPPSFDPAAGSRPPLFDPAGGNRPPSSGPEDNPPSR